MLFKNYVDEKGHFQIKKKDGEGRYKNDIAIIDPSIFPELTEKSLHELKIISHYIKNGVCENIANVTQIFLLFHLKMLKTE